MMSIFSSFDAVVPEFFGFTVGSLPPVQLKKDARVGASQRKVLRTVEEMKKNSSKPTVPVGSPNEEQRTPRLHYELQLHLHLHLPLPHCRWLTVPLFSLTGSHCYPKTLYKFNHANADWRALLPSHRNFICLELKPVGQSTPLLKFATKDLKLDRSSGEIN
ncbi:hypothetical protein NE237_006399 [Protea cynaroides]|uniref:Uncharacterized protein n=1 Tax=Protea cynaroides TaxID=273540 RepID=A0A9Q0QV50_9MAGN|nr:hypothetical protein NE237_006399 [Protea cynaroides]